MLALDVRGLRCPWPALRVARAMRTATLLQVTGDDALARSEIAALARQHGWNAHFADTSEGDDRKGWTAAISCAA